MSAATVGLVCDWCRDCRDSDGRLLLGTADKPCWGLNGTDYRMGANGAVQGDINHYGDYVYSQEAMKIISEHDLQIPLYFCAHLTLQPFLRVSPPVQTAIQSMGCVRRHRVPMQPRADRGP